MANKSHLMGNIIALLCSALVGLSTSLPYYLLNENAPGSMVFSGMSTNIPDEASYLMWSRQHANGAFLTTNHMTTDPHDRILPNPAWLAVGLIARVTGSDVLVSYHVARTFFSFLYLFVLWLLLLRIMPTRNVARFAWTVIALGGGLGWLTLTGLDIPSADWITELWSWPSMLHYPHFALSLLLLVTFLVLWVDNLEKPGRLRPILAGLTLSLLALVHPYTAGTLIGAIMVHFAFIVWRTARANRDSPHIFALSIRQTPGLSTMLGFALPGLAIVVLQTLVNPILADWATQNQMPSPPPWQYLFGLGVVGVLAVIRVARAVPARAPALPAIESFFAVWFVVAMLLAYADPLVPFARRCVEGIHIGLVCLATTMIFTSTRRTKAILVAAVLVTTMPAPFYHLSREVRADNPGYVVPDHHQMIDAVRTYVKEGAVLGDARTSLFVAAQTDASVFVGHHEVSPDFLKKAKLLHEFMNRPTTWRERRDMLSFTRCQWMLANPRMIYGLLDNRDGSTLAQVGLREYARGDSWVLIGPVSD